MGPLHRSAVITAVLFLASLPLIASEKDSNPYAWGTNPNTRFKMYWNDARNVLQDLGKFSALYVQYHGCVWSECSRGDNYDDDGENRDGDEYWYQYRTQPFCANAAYSLYGVLRGRLSLPFNSCRRATYINSFFTYGGADTLFRAFDATPPSTTFDGMYADDDAYANKNSNAVCYEIDSYGRRELGFLGGGAEGSGISSSSSLSTTGQQRRDLGSGDNNNNNNQNSMSSTMGCTKDGKFAVATFRGDTCDGNYFLETTDNLRSYNRAINRLAGRCKQIWTYKKKVVQESPYVDSTRQRRRRLQAAESDRRLEDNQDDGYYYYTPQSVAEELLLNSWACDRTLYPKGCPDPYGLKKKYDSILAAVANGQSPRTAITAAKIRGPARFFSTLFLLVGTALFCAAYYIQNKERIKGDGLCKTFWSDFKVLCKKTWKALALCCGGLLVGWSALRERARKAAKERRKLRKKKKKKKSKIGLFGTSKKKKKKKKSSRHGNDVADSSTLSDSLYTDMYSEEPETISPPVLRKDSSSDPSSHVVL